jgi:hypothetical protein
MGRNLRLDDGVCDCVYACRGKINPASSYRPSRQRLHSSLHVNGKVYESMGSSKQHRMRPCKPVGEVLKTLQPTTREMKKPARRQLVNVRDFLQRTSSVNTVSLFSIWFGGRTAGAAFPVALCHPTENRSVSIKVPTYPQGDR